VKILAVTLARGGSKGIPRKNLTLLHGEPLINHTFKQVVKSKYISRYIVSTDDVAIQSHCAALNVECPFIRPPHLATDEASSSDALIHALEFCEAQDGLYDYIVELMCTNPFKTVEDIDFCIERLMSTGADSVIGVSQVDEYHPARMKKIVDGRLVDFCVPEHSGRRQDLFPKAYIRNGSIYALKRLTLYSGMRLGGPNTLTHLMPPERSINIDTPLDLILAESLHLHKDV
jgi:CMP-N,N'-diacetyllegionaminic acid synthase